MRAYSFLNTALPQKDQKSSLTMMLDKGLGLNAVDDLLETAGGYISFAKLGWGTSATMSRELIAAKNAKYAEKGIIPYPGGTLLEVALEQDKLALFLKETAELGFKGIEVSDGSTRIEPGRRAETIEQAREAGFFVISEVGKKNPELDRQFTVAERLGLIKADLAHGSSYVIIEAREAGKNIGIYDDQGNILEDELDELAADGISHLIFEAPLKNQQVELILKFGPEVNLGNIAWDEVTALETLREGLRGDTLGKLENRSQPEAKCQA